MKGKDGAKLAAGGAMSQEEVLEKYADMIDLPRPEMRHSRMSRGERAAQFAPFAALVGFARKVQESGAEFLEEVESEEEILAEFEDGRFEDGSIDNC